jgi:MFS family permease
VFTLGTKTFFGAALVALAAAVGLAAVSSDQAGFVVLIGAMLALVALGVVVVYGAGAADRYSYDGHQDSRPARDPGHSPTPFLAALSAGLFLVGFAMGAPFLVVGAVAMAICVAVWFSEVWRDHPDYVRALTKRASSYVSIPFGMPLMLVTVIGFVAISVSRTLLAVNHTAAWIIAIIVAAAVFVSALILAARPKLSGRTMVAVVALGAAIILGMGIYGQVQGRYSSGEGHGSEHGATHGDGAKASAEETP